MTLLATHAHKGGSTTVSPAQGGCGKTHEYVIGPTGYPEFTCHEGCEEAKRNEPGNSLHATMPAKVPEDYDEKITREDLETRSLKHRDLILAIAAARSAGMTAEADLLALQAGLPIANASVRCPDGHQNSPTQHFCGTCGKPIAQASVLCLEGHDNRPGARFCSTCGQPMSAPAAKALSAPESPSETAPAPSPAPVGPAPARLRDARLETLQALARTRGLSEDGTRPDLISRLAGAGVTNADLRRFLDKVPAAA